MLFNKKCFLFVVVGLLIFNCGVYAQDTGASQVVAPAVVESSQAVTKSAPMDTAGLTDVQLMNTINKSMNVVEGVNTDNKQTVGAVGENKAQQQTTPAAPTAPTASAPTASAIPTIPTIPAASTTSAAPATPITTPAAAVPQENQTQIELELNKKVSYKIFYLSKPERLIIDIKDSSFTAEFDKTAFKNSPIKNIRTAHRDDGIFRIVFDLKQPVNFQHSEQVSDNNSSSTESMKLLVEISPKEATKKKK